MIRGLLEEYISLQQEYHSTGEECMERVTETYDTSQPVDSLTGRPPLQSRVMERSESRMRGEGRSRSEGTVTGQESVQQTHEENVTHRGESSEREDSHESNETEITENRGGGVVYVLLHTAGSMMIALFIAWLLLTIGKAIKYFLKTD